MVRRFNMVLKKRVQFRKRSHHVLVALVVFFIDSIDPNPFRCAVRCREEEEEEEEEEE
jgi:hypothetical protein